MIDAAELMAYWPNLIGKARATLPYADPVLWEDAAASTLEAACRQQIAQQDRDPLPWLLTTVKRRALDLVTTADVRHADHSKRINRATVDAGNESHLTRMAVQAALGRLPVHLSEYATARLQGLGILEAGAKVGWPRSTASRREDELRAQLKILLGGIA